MEVYIFFSDELHTNNKSPENKLKQKLKCVPMNNPMAQVYNYVIFSNKIGIRRFWVKEPRQCENILAEM